MKENTKEKTKNLQPKVQLLILILSVLTTIMLTILITIKNKNSINVDLTKQIPKEYIQAMYNADEEEYKSTIPTKLTFLKDDVYLIPMKDRNGIIVKYKAINTENIDIQSEGSTVQEVKDNYYYKQFSDYNPITDEMIRNEEYEGYTVKRVNNVIINGNTTLIIDTEVGQRMYLNINIYEDLHEIKSGDTLNFEGKEDERGNIQITEILRRN